jgi:predicted RNase H-like HicB family nuclease
MKYLVTLQKDAEDGGYAVGCPTLPGCWSQGESEAEALENMAAAIRDYLAVQTEQGRGTPAIAIHEIDVA